MGHHCCSKQKVKRGLWSPEEDEKLIKYITTHGHGCWSSVPKLAGLQRCGKSCRLRWMNYLRPDVKRGCFSEQEERIIIDVHRIVGNRWAQIAKHLPGRTDNEVKNFWNSCIKKKLIAQGLDPNTHNLLSSHQPTNNHQQPTTAFAVNSHIKMPFVISLPPLPHNNTATDNSTYSLPLHESTGIPSFDYQNPNFSHAPMEFTSQSTSSLNPSGFGHLNENCMWSNGFDTFPFKREDEAMELLQEKAFDVEVDKTTESGGIQIMEASFDSSDFDFEFMDQSSLPPCGLYSNVNSMDHLPWDF